MDGIIDYKKDATAVSMNNRYQIVKGRKYLRKTTKGWHMCVNWRDGTSTWERLADLKQSNSVEVAEFAIAMDITHQPAFAWWVPYTVKKRDMIISTVNRNFLKWKHKFGIAIPSSMRDAKIIDN